jgi:hypothetical protein
MLNILSLKSTNWVLGRYFKLILYTHSLVKCKKKIRLFFIRGVCAHMSKMKITEAHSRTAHVLARYVTLVSESTGTFRNISAEVIGSSQMGVIV